MVQALFVNSMTGFWYWKDQKTMLDESIATTIQFAAVFEKNQPSFSETGIRFHFHKQQLAWLGTLNAI